MRRERKEIIKKLEWFAMMHEADAELGCGFGGYTEQPEEEALQVRLAQTYGFSDYMNMLFEHQERFNNSFFKKEAHDDY